ncbi:uncharacterized protein METZ01_LOCUS475550 [marine metagenome]|uniref:PEGA domain-containing protein n=1 Tax=marine metagenome TaxID=408172 RepID=A0A383BR22_9ZZZZ
MSKNLNYLILLWIFILSSCATITRGTKDTFVINSNPSGATAITSHGYTCVTPCSLNLPRKENFVVTVRKTGYCDAQATVTSITGAAGSADMAGNVLVGGIIGMGTDAITGATRDLVPNPLDIVLEECD